MLRLRGRLDGGLSLCLRIVGGRGVDALRSMVGGLAEGHRCCDLLDLFRALQTTYMSDVVKCMLLGRVAG
jgi:hypothetical protein